MSWSSPSRPATGPTRRAFATGLVALAMVVTAAPAGCTLAPVYGDHGVATTPLALSFSEPRSRLEQIVYNELALRFPGAPGAEPVELAANVFSRGSVLARAITADPAKPRRVTVTARVKVTRDGEQLASFVRTASADYTTSGQVLANNEAASEAEERATRAVAESIRLALLGILAAP